MTVEDDWNEGWISDDDNTPSTEKKVELISELIGSFALQILELEKQVKELQNKKCRCEYTIGGRNTYGGAL